MPVTTVPTPRSVNTRSTGKRGLPKSRGESAYVFEIGGLILARVVSRFITGIEIPGAVPLAGAALVLIAAALLASLMPAARASRVEVVSALRGD